MGPFSIYRGSIKILLCQNQIKVQFQFKWSWVSFWENWKKCGIWWRESNTSDSEHCVELNFPLINIYLSKDQITTERHLNHLGTSLLGLKWDLIISNIWSALGFISLLVTILIGLLSDKLALRLRTSILFSNGLLYFSFSCNFYFV